MYAHIRDRCLEDGDGKKVCERIAAATVNKHRAAQGLGRGAPPKRMATTSEAAQRIAKRTGVGPPSKLPLHIRPYAEFLRLRQGVPPTARDVIKAYAITRSSVQRGSVPRATLCKSYPEFRELARMGQRKDVRPEDVFAAWFFTPSGQRWLDAAQQGRFDAASARKIAEATSCWGLQNTLLDDLRYAVKLGRRTTEIQKALASDSAAWIDYVRQNVRGVSLAKAGFLASLLGRGDIATFDARERKLWVGPKVPKTWDPRPADLERFRKRVRTFPMELEPEHEPFREHLVHHALWDAFPERGKPTKTTHGSVIRAMQFAGARKRRKR